MMQSEMQPIRFEGPRLCAGTNLFILLPIIIRFSILFYFFFIFKYLSKF